MGVSQAQKSQGNEAPAATRFIAFAPNFPSYIEESRLAHSVSNLILSSEELIHEESNFIATFQGGVVSSRAGFPKCTRPGNACTEPSQISPSTHSPTHGGLLQGERKIGHEWKFLYKPDPA